MNLINENLPFLNVIRAMALIAPTKDIRYYLNSIAVFYNGEDVVGVTACSGHMLLSVGDVSNHDGYLLIPTGEIKRFIKSLEIQDIIARKTQLLERLESLDMPVQDERYPAIARLIHSFEVGKPAECMGVSSQYISVIDKVVKALSKGLPCGKEKSLGVKLKLTEHTGTVVTIKIEDTLFSLCISPCLINF